MRFCPQSSDQTTSKALAMAYSASYCICAIVAASLLLSCAGLVPHSAVSQQPVFDCANIIGAEKFDDLVKRVVKVAENQAFLTTQSVPPEQHPVSVLPSGKWETQKPGAPSPNPLNRPNAFGGEDCSACRLPIPYPPPPSLCFLFYQHRPLDGRLLARCALAAARTDWQADMGG